DNGHAEATKPGAGWEIVRPTPGWNTKGDFSQIAYGLDSRSSLGKDDPGPADRGLAYFWGGNSQVATGVQLIDLGGVSQTVDSGALTFAVNAYLGGTTDEPCKESISLRFLSQ